MLSRRKILDPLRIRLSGRGGQGIILSGVIVAQAAMYDGRYVVHTQSYGPEARLGASKSEVVVSHLPIAFPEVAEANLFLCLSQAAYDKYGAKMEPGGVSVLDDHVRVDEPLPGQTFYPLRQAARELGNELAANIVGLGVLVAASQMTTDANLRRAIMEWVKPEFLTLNLQAFDEGLRLGERAPANV